MVSLSDDQRELLAEKRTFAHFATLMPDGTPQVTPVWVDYDAEADRVLVNTTRGRQKAKNVERDRKVGLSAQDPDDPYRFVSIRGAVTDLTEEGAVEHIDELARRYMDVEEYPNKDQEESPRVVVEIRPDRVTGGQS